MSCCGIINHFNIECEKKVKAVEIFEWVNHFDSTTVKMIKLLDKQAIIESVSYAGNGSFDENGFYYEDYRYLYKYKIEYKDKVTFQNHNLLIR